MAETVSPPPQQPPATDPIDGGGFRVPKAVRDNAEKLVAGLFTVGGLTAVVAFAGAVISWARFHAAKLPAQQAVEALSQSERIAVGASGLGVFVALGALALVVAYAGDPGGRPTHATANALLAIALVELVVIVAYDVDGELWQLALAVVVLGVAAYFVWRLLKPAESNLVDDLEPTRKERQFAHEADPAVRGRLTDRAQRRKRLVLTTRARLTLGLVIVVVASTTGVILWEWWVLVATLTAMALSWGLFYVALRTGGTFAWFGVAVFFSVVLLGSVVGVLRLLDDPQVQPAALIRTVDGPSEGLQGLYIARNDEEVVLGSVATKGCGSSDVKGGSGRLVSFPRDEVVSLGIGPHQSVGDAALGARDMLVDLIAARAPAAPETQQSIQGSAPRLPRSVDELPAVRQEPRIEEMVAPEPAAPGATVELKGSAFGDRNGVVLIGDTRVRAKSWKKDLITFEVPAIERGGVVSVHCQTQVGRHFLTVRPTAAR